MINKIWQLLERSRIKILKSMIYLALAIVAVICGMQYALRNEIWIDFVSNNIRGRFLIPKSITAAKDCDKFLQWQNDNLPEEEHRICPWPS